MNVIGACCNPHNTQVARRDILDEAGEEEKIVPGEDESEYELDKDVADHRELWAYNTRELLVLQTCLHVRGTIF